MTFQRIPTSIVEMLYRGEIFLVRERSSRREMSFVERPAFLTDVIIDGRHFVVIAEHGGDTIIEEIVVEGEP